MTRFLADENFSAKIVRALRRHLLEEGLPELDLEWVQEIGLRGAPDRDVLAAAAAQGRILLTHDVNTMPSHAYERLESGLPVAGVIVVGRGGFEQLAVDIALVAHGRLPQDWDDPVVFVPL